MPEDNSAHEEMADHDLIRQALALVTKDTYRDAAAKLGVSRQTVYRWRRAEKDKEDHAALSASIRETLERVIGGDEPVVRGDSDRPPQELERAITSEVAVRKYLQSLGKPGENGLAKRMAIGAVETLISPFRKETPEWLEHFRFQLRSGAI